MFMLGYAYQLGYLPLTAAAIERAIELNGQAVAMNLAAFQWGRYAVAFPEKMAKRMVRLAPPRQLAQTLEEIITRRVSFLTAYQNAAYAERYRRLVEQARLAERKILPDSQAFAETVARNLFRLMAYKDEYEVARLYSDGQFEAQVKAAFEGEKLRYEFHLAPPLFARMDPDLGRPRKVSYRHSMIRFFRVLAAFKFLRGTVFDIFGHTHERKVERQLIADYEAMLDELTGGRSAGNLDIAVALAGIPQKIRGFGHIKDASIAIAKKEEAFLLAQFRASPQTPFLMAAE